MKLELQERTRIGALTWKAEGYDSAPERTQRIHWPGGNSGVTIGRGYDMGERTPDQIRADLMLAGVSREDATTLSIGAGKRGESAKLFVRKQRADAPTLSTEQEQKLFDVVTYPRYREAAKSLSERSDIADAYGAFTFEEAPEPVQALVTDLLYRGDYTPETRTYVQPALVSGKNKDLCEALAAMQAERVIPAERQRLREESLDCKNKPRSIAGAPYS